MNNKFLFLAASAAIALSSCSNEDELAQAGDVLEDGQVAFNAYTARNTRAAADIIDNNYLKVNGFGVYAFEQGTTPWNTYRASNTYPNFFYNQKVAYEDIESFDLKSSIGTSEFEALTSSVLKNAYKTENTGSKWNPTSAITDLANLDILLAKGGTFYTAYVTSATVTLKEHITTAEFGTLSPALQAKYVVDGVNGYQVKETSSVKETLNLSEYETAYSLPNDKAVCVSAVVTLKTGIPYDDKIALTDVNPYLKHLYSTESTTGVRNADPATISLDSYKALTTNFDRSLCVDYTSASNVFQYSPIKYYSNNVGAKHSFFAYAPYAKNVTAVFTNEGPSIRYNGSDSYDLLWADPILNKEKAGVTERLMFNFKHALSKVSFQVSTFVNEVHPGTAPGHALSVIDENTTITLRSVKFAGVVPSKGLLNLANGSWKIESSDENIYEFAPEDAIVLNNENLEYWNDGETAKYVPVSQDNMVIPTSAENKIKVQVVYDVVTRDASNPQNSSSVTNTVKSEEEFELLAGVAYRFNLDLGLTSVKFNAQVVDWTDPELNNTVDLPNNHGLNALRVVNVGSKNATQISGTLTEKTEKPTFAANAANYNPITKQLSVAGSSVWEVADPAKYYYKGNVLYMHNGTNWDRYNVDIVKNTTGYAEISDPSTAITVIELQSTATNSDGKVQQIDGTWITPVVDNYYRVGDKVYIWRVS